MDIRLSAIHLYPVKGIRGESTARGKMELFSESTWFRKNRE